MQRSNMSCSLCLRMKFRVFSNDESEEEVSDLDWISTDDGKEDKEEISSYDSSSKPEMDDQPCPSVSANYFLSKTKT